MSLVALDYPSAGVIIAVMMLNIGIGFYQEYNSESTMDALKKMSSPVARVLRDGGQVQQVPAVDLVLGDVVLLEEGDQVPADLRLLDAVNLLVDEALLTGES